MTGRAQKAKIKKLSFAMAAEIGRHQQRQLTELFVENERLKKRVRQCEKQDEKIIAYAELVSKFFSRTPIQKCDAEVQADIEVVVPAPPAMEPTAHQAVIEEVQPPRKKKAPKLLAKVKQEVMETDEVATTATLNVPGTSHKDSRLEEPDVIITKVKQGTKKHVRVKPEPMEIEDQPAQIATPLPPAQIATPLPPAQIATPLPPARIGTPRPPARIGTPRPPARDRVVFRRPLLPPPRVPAPAGFKLESS